MSLFGYSTPEAVDYPTDTPTDYNLLVPTRTVTTSKMTMQETSMAVAQPSILIDLQYYLWHKLTNWWTNFNHLHQIAASTTALQIPAPQHVG